MAEFNIGTLQKFLQVIDLTRNLQTRNVLTLEEADNITGITKDQLVKYIDSIYKKAPEKPKPEVKKDEPSGTPETRKPDTKSPSST